MSEQMKGDIHRKQLISQVQKHLGITGIYSRGLILAYAADHLPKTEAEIVKLVTKDISEKKIFG